MRPRLTLAPLLSLSLLAAACGGGEEADPDAVNARMRAILPGLIDPTSAAVTFAGESTAMAGVTGSLAAIDGLGLPLSLGGGGELATFSHREGATGDEAADALAEAIFTEENHEGGGVYRVPGELVCPADETGAIDPECVETVDALELRVRAELIDDGIDLTLLVGPDRAAPLTLELRPARAALVIDLAEAAAALAHVASVTGAEIELPEVFEGQVAFGLEVHGPEHVAFAVAVRQAVRIEGGLAEGRLAFSTEARDPLALLDIDGAAREITAALDLGRTVLAMPNSMADPLSLATGVRTIDWKGLSFTATARDGEDRIEVSDIGLGDDTSTVSLDATTLVAVDLNADDGRRVSLAIEPDPAGGLPRVAFDPGLDLVIDVFLQPLADAGDYVESWLLDDTYRIALDGDRPATQAIAGDDVTGEPGALRVARGTLTVAADSAAVVVEAGGCLVADPVTDGEHPIIGALAAGACPQ